MKLPDSRKDLEEKSTSKKNNLKVSRIDFLGLDFVEKKTYRGMPPGLASTVEPLVDGDFPEVELIVGDPSKFETARPLETVNQEENDDNKVLYKPKVSTWGVFPRPNNISKMVWHLCAIYWNLNSLMLLMMHCYLFFLCLLVDKA